MNTFGDAYVTESSTQLSVVFGRVGYDWRFRVLLDDFKQTFPFRRWEGNGWVMPVSQRSALVEFCRQHGLMVIYRRQ